MTRLEEGRGEVQRVYLHVSDAKMFRDCRRRWFFASPRMSNLQPNYPDTAFWLGIGVHLALQYYYRNDGKRLGPDRVQLVAEALTLFSEWSTRNIDDIYDRVKGNIDESKVQDLRDTRELGLAILEHYFDWCPAEDDFRVRHTETDFELPLLYDGKPLQFTTKDGRVIEMWIRGRIDAVVEKPDGSWWLIEHKTARTISPQLTTFYALSDEQSGLYVHAAERTFGHPVEGVVYNLLRKKAPAIPNTLQSGELSQRKNIDTTADVYRQALEAAGITDPVAAGYGGILALLEEKGNKFFYRDHVFRTKAEIADLLRRFYYISQEMYDNPVIYPTPDMMKCARCPFSGVSLAMANGGDWKGILAERFHQRADYELAPDNVDIADPAETT